MSEPAPMDRTIRTLVLIMGALLGLVVITKFLPGGAGPRAEARTVLAAEWRPTSVLGLTLSSPGTFRPVAAPVPQNVRASIDRLESSGHNLGETELRVTRIEYRAGLPLSLEGAAQGAVDAMRQNPGVAGLAHSHAQTQVSGVPAVRTTSEFRAGDKPMHGEILTVLRERTLWQVQVLGHADAAPELARRVMESVRLQP